MHKTVRKAIFNKYAPRIDKAGKQVVDPDVLYVGPFIDGLLELMPELFEDEFRPLAPTGRRGAKLFLMDVFRAPQSAGDVYGAVIMQRGGWPKTANGEPMSLQLRGSRLIDEEPGALTNSILVDAEGQLRDTTTGAVVEPIIREEKQYGLHYLKRGDYFDVRWQDRQRRVHRREFRLKPRSEGTSEIVAEAREDVKTF